MIALHDRVQETTTVTGTGDPTLAGADIGYRAISSVLSAGDQFPYGIIGGAEWEIGIGTFNGGSPSTFTRTTVLASSNAGALVSFSAGTKKVFLTMAARMIPFHQVTTDPATPLPGETWFNTTSNTFKGSVDGTPAFTTGATYGGNPVTGVGGAGSNTAGVAFGGMDTSGPLYYAGAFTFNGTAWTSTSSMSASKSFAANWGTQGDALCAGGMVNGGNAIATLVKFNGATWSTLTAASQSAMYVAGAGTGTSSGMKAGGISAGTLLTNVEIWNGTTWAAGTAFPTATQRMAGCGTVLASIFFGGSVTTTPTDALTTSRTFNGTAWTSTGALPASRSDIGGFGNSSEAVGCGGWDATNPQQGTVRWAGAVWSTGSANMATSRRNPGVWGSSSRNGMDLGGSNAGFTALASCDKYNHPTSAVKSFTIA